MRDLNVQGLESCTNLGIVLKNGKHKLTEDAEAKIKKKARELEDWESKSNTREGAAKSRGSSHSSGSKPQRLQNKTV